MEEVEGRARYELSHEYLVKHIGDWIEESEREVTKVLEVIESHEPFQFSLDFIQGFVRI